MAPRRGRVRRGQQGLLTILFTDLEGSTAMTQRLGDARAQEVVRAHNTIVRREVSTRGGTEVKHTGDGIMATFPSAASAVAAAVAMQQASRTYNDAHPETAFNIGFGLNAGEPVAEDADVFGSAVQLAARTCAEAKGGQILATNVVRELVYGKGALFADVGAAELKGFDEPVHLFEVSIGAGGIDEGEQKASSRLTLFAAIAAVAAVVAVGAVVLVLARPGAGEGEDGEPQYTVIHTRSVEAVLTPDEVTGDCVTTPLIVKGRLEAPFTGDISVVVSARYEVAYSLADQCKSYAASGTSVSKVDDGSTLNGVEGGFSLKVLGSESAQTTDVINAQIVTSGTGVYADVAGRNVCRVSTLFGPTLDPRAGKAGLECTTKLAPRVSLPPVIFQPIASAEKVTTQLAPSSRGDTFKIMLLYFNTRDDALSGLSVRLPVPSGAQISSSAGEGGSMAEGPREWELPDLAPGEVASFEITVRLLSAEEDSITLLPEIAMQGRKHTFTSDPIVLTVER